MSVYNRLGSFAKDVRLPGALESCNTNEANAVAGQACPTLPFYGCHTMSDPVDLPRICPRSQAFRGVAAVIFSAMCLLMVLIQLISRARMEAREAQCRGRLAQIGLAIQNYHAVNGSFPPICVCDHVGKPIHSWRVLILPYCGLTDVYERYDFSQAWNSLKNAALANEVHERVAHMFQCPNDFNARDDWTTFLAIENGGGLDVDRLVVTHGVSTRIQPVIMETHQSKIHWMEPRDLSMATARAGIVHQNPESGVVNFLSSDAQIWSLSSDRLTFRNSESEIIERLLKKDEDSGP